MALKYWRGQSATVEVSGNSLPSEAIGVLDDPEVSAPEQEVSVLRGAGSAKPQDKQRTAVSASASGELSAFDIDTWDRLIDYDDANDELNDSAEVPEFTISFTFKAADGSTKLIEVTGHVDGSIPIGGSREEWIGLSIEITEGTLTITNTDNAP